MKTKLLVSALFAITAGVVVAYPMTRDDPQQPPPKHPVVHIAPAAKPKVEVVFVLDTTGSMSGLIQAAKENIWAIATTMAQAQPAPEIRMGLVAFRDRGDEYVTRVVDLSQDLDSVYATLMDFQADGGGDTPESVNQALHEAVTRMSWSQDKDAYKVVFLVGDAPPHEYDDDVDYPTTIGIARGKGIVVNTILAGQDPQTKSEWERIAALNQGRFFNVGQQGDAIAVTTPFDDQIAQLSAALDKTRMFFGDSATQSRLEGKVAATEKLHAASSPAARAKRAAFNASAGGRGNALGENELVDAVSSGRVDLAELDADVLPPSIRELGKDEQVRVVAEAAEQRKELNAKIAALSTQRQAFIDEELAKKKDVAQSFDHQLYDAVKAQAGEKGITYDAPAPAH